jgi:hypothetical protein
VERLKSRDEIKSIQSHHKKINFMKLKDNNKNGSRSNDPVMGKSVAKPPHCFA